MLSHHIHFTPALLNLQELPQETATLIDNIFTNSKSKQTFGIIITDLSDHLPIFISTDLYVSRNTVKSDVEIRQYTTESVNKLKNELKNVDWENVCNSSDVNESYTNFVNTFNKIHDECIPLKKKRFRSQKNNSRSPWISFALLKCIRRKSVLYKKFLKKPTDVNIEKYKKYRNRPKLNSTLRLAKWNYFADLLEKEKNNMRNTWKVINSIIRPKINTCTDKFVSENTTYTCPIEIATEFNNYFANIGPKLASTIQHNGKNFSSYLLKQSNMSTCFFKPTNEHEVLKIIKRLGSRKSAGHDDIKSDVIKQVAKEIASPLTMIFNTSLSTGIVPDDLKIAKVVPIYKKDNPEVFWKLQTCLSLTLFVKNLGTYCLQSCI